VRPLARLLLGISVVFLIGCAQKDWIDRTLVTENVTGAWAGSVGVGVCYREVRLDLQQDGTKVTGVASMSLSGAPFPIQGSMSGDVFTFKSARGGGTGELTVSGDDMSGQVLWGCGNSRLSLHRVDSVSRTGSPPR
jgi:hypothetical protein